MELLFAQDDDWTLRCIDGKWTLTLKQGAFDPDIQAKSTDDAHQALVDWAEELELESKRIRWFASLFRQIIGGEYEAKKHPAGKGEGPGD